jgi:cyclophilin family peptidyl-prolyl cis-trans isomerase
VATEKRQRQKANRQLKYQQQAKVAQRQRLTKRVVLGVVAAVALLGVVLFLAFVVGGDDDEASPTEPSALASAAVTSVAPTTPATGSLVHLPFTYGTGECPPAEGVSEPVKVFTAAPAECIDPSRSYTARIVTDHGDIVVALDTANSPGTVNNFVTLARYGYYDDTRIFRTDQGIDIIQGGGLTNSDPFGYTIPDEGSGYTYPVGRIAMANTGQPNSAGAQWFVTVGERSSSLDQLGTYVVFGEVTEGLDVAQAMLALATAPDDDTPSEQITVQRVEITEA